MFQSNQIYNIPWWIYILWFSAALSWPPYGNVIRAINPTTSVTLKIYQIDWLLLICGAIAKEVCLLNVCPEGFKLSLVRIKMCSWKKKKKKRRMLWNLPSDWHADKKNNNKLDIFWKILAHFVHFIPGTLKKIWMYASNFITYSELIVKGHR